MLSPATIENLKKLAERKTWPDNVGEGEIFDVQDWAGGNFDDAYAGGEEDGATNLARDILAELGVPFKA